MCKVVVAREKLRLIPPRVRHSAVPPEAAKRRALSWNTNNAGPMRSRVKQGLSICADRFNISARLRNGRCRAFTLETCTCSRRLREGVGRERYTRGIFAADLPMRDTAPRQLFIQDSLRRAFILLLMRQTRLPSRLNGDYPSEHRFERRGVKVIIRTL